MPFLWKQDPDLKWNPKSSIYDNDKVNSELIQKNFDDVKKYYDNLTLVCLIDKKGSQLRLGEYYDKLNNRLND